MAPSRILIVGSGGREHALARRLASDEEVREVLLAPGSEGAARRFRCLPLGEADPGALIEACRRERVDLVVIGPESPLAAGLADAFREAALPVFGPSREAARLESSKWFAKQVMTEAGVSTARAERHEAPAAALEALARFAPPWVLKADGLAGGKGVCVTSERAEAESFLASCLEGKRFGASGRAVLIEEFLAGEEVSVMAVCDGERHVLLTPARDYKRAFDGDRGANTGGMGAFAPVPAWNSAADREVSERIVAPMLGVMLRRGSPFRGLLYCGLMRVPEGLRVVEFNVRFGDPETQVVLPLTTGSLAVVLESAARGSLAEGAVRRAEGAALAVALVDERYPENPAGGGRIEGLDGVENERVHVLHAATRREGGAWTVRGGRAAYVVAEGADRAAARAAAYEAIGKLGGTGWRCRRDIAAGIDDEAPKRAGPARATERMTP